MKKWLIAFVCAALPLCVAAQQNWKAVMRYDRQSAKTALTERLTRYVKYDTASDPTSAQVPSTKGQLTFGKVLAKELKRIGAQNVKIGKTGIVTAEIPATTAQEAPTVAFVAHMDSVSSTGKNTEAHLHAKYRGGNLVLNSSKNLYLTEQANPQLFYARGHDLLTASGETSLGADGKAGIAILMTLADYLLGNTNIEHGLIKIAFVPDGQLPSAHTLDTAAIGADYAYALSGANAGEIVVENFNKRSFTAIFNGERGVPVGAAMNTAFADNLLMASDFHTLLPRHRRPETTSSAQGFIYVNDIQTQGNRSTVKGDIYAFSEAELAELTDIVDQSFKTVKAMNPKNKGVELAFTDSYKNAKDITPAPLLAVLEQAMTAEEISPKHISARGNTLAAALSFKGLPTAGLFAGVFNPSDLTEYADIDIMEASLRTLLSASVHWSQHPKTQP